MKTSRHVRYAALLLATSNWVLPLPQLHALEPPTPSAAKLPAVHVNDIALGKTGQLRGYVLDRQGHPTEAYRLKVLQGDRTSVEVVTNKQGRFQLDGMHGGMFQVAAGKQTYLCRGWAAGTAPPKARDQLLVVPDGVIQRAQRPIGDLFSDPVMIGLVVAAAIAIPIAVSNSKNSSSPGS